MTNPPDEPRDEGAGRHEYPPPPPSQSGDPYAAPPAGGYGSPPPSGGYGSTSGGYGSPPPPSGGYGSTSGGEYGSPPPPSGYGQQPGYGGYAQQPAYGTGYGAPATQSNTPMILGIIGIVCWFLCSPASIVLGLIGQSQARRMGQSQTLPRVAWIGGIVFVLLGILYAVFVIGVIAKTGTSTNY